MKKIVLICNSNNTDLAIYFKVKCLSLKNNNFQFFATKKLALQTGSKISSYNDKNGIGLGFILDIFFSIWVLIKILYSKVDVVIFDTAHISNLPLSFLLKVFGFGRIKQIFTIHDWNPHEGKHNFVVKLYNSFTKKFLADEFILFSNVKDNSTKTKHILSLSGFSDSSAHSYNGNYFLFFGRFEPYKGLNYLVDIALKLQVIAPNLLIKVVGNGYDDNICKLQSLKNVLVVNRFIESDELDLLISGASSVLLPYKSATQSGVVLHAYSFSKPVIAFDVGSLNEYILNDVSGFLIEPYDINRFVDKMLESHRKYASLNKSTHTLFDKKFNEEALAKQYRILFNKI
ncbi:glycosyltransferase [Pseudoalteromonas fuliginea]|uniref:glycosyltransferase family 4 protein n=1 Tax=Pseudoalteromonas fuliginea TaxID=1872678 RepID=UPI00317AB0E8